MQKAISTIVLPTRPQPDTIVAIFLLREFGKEQFPGIESANVAVEPKATPADGKLLLDVGGGEFDHHGTDKCASEIVAQKLGVLKNPELRSMITYARRDDTQGKGTISKDPIDRTFGLSGLIAGLNKQFTTDADKVVKTVLPLLEAQYKNAYEHFVELPQLVKSLEQMNMFSDETINSPIKNTKIAFVSSDHTGLPGYLRSNNGGGYRVVTQRRTSGHVNIMTKQNPKIDLSHLMALIRLHELNLAGKTIPTEETLYETGAHEQIPHWYFDPATNSLLNGGISPDEISATNIPWVELQAIILSALPESKIIK